MKKKTQRKVTVWLAVLCLVLFLLFAYICNLPGRIIIISDYLKLVSDPDNLERLRYAPAFYVFDTADCEDLISIGYAEFVFPFGEIETVSIKDFQRVWISSPNALMVIPSPVLLEGHARKEDAKDYLAFYTYAGGEFKQRNKRFEQYDIKMWELDFEDPFNFTKTMYEVQPGEFYSKLFGRFSDMYVHEKMLEFKNSHLFGKSEVFFFETETVKGRVDISKEINSLNVVLLWDLEQTIMFLAGFEFTEQISNDKIISGMKEYIRSFSLHTDIIKSSSGDLRSIIVEALSKYDYVDSPDSESDLGHLDD
jgi:hypothetical protein